MNCEDCAHATWDYEEYYNGGREYFVDGCKKDYYKDEDDDCPHFLWRKDDEE